MNLNVRLSTAWWARLYLSGPIEVAKQVLRRECKEEGLCVTVEPTLFIYTGGEEFGYVVGLIQYPKHYTPVEALEQRAEKILRSLVAETYQSSGLMMTPNKTLWIKDEA